MRYPIFTVPNPNFEGAPTEYTAVLLDGNKVEVYVETVKRFEDGNVDFADVTFILPDNIVKESHGLTDDEIDIFKKHVFRQTDDIIEYVIDEEAERVER